MSGEQNRYNSTPRKVFDKHVDRMELKRQRDKQDHRADMQALIKRLVNLENVLDNLTDVGKEQKLEQTHPELEQLPDGRWRRKTSTGEP